MSRTADLIGAAKMVRLNARAPHSGFKVGAALETRKGRIYGGCNVENATYGLTVCAERVAIWKALSEGETEFRRIAVVADSDSLTPPCGACRQIIWEYCGDIEVLLANLGGKKVRYRVSELLPLPFDKRLLTNDSK
jgi:cytidine deaminase